LKCKICDNDCSNGGYCEPHNKAHEAVVKAYILWKRALEISWKEYLREIVNNPLTGEWSREVAQYLIENGERENVTES